jgi:hypothetical protein
MCRPTKHSNSPSPPCASAATEAHICGVRQPTCQPALSPRRMFCGWSRAPSWAACVAMTDMPHSGIL